MTKAEKLKASQAFYDAIAKDAEKRRLSEHPAERYFRVPVSRKLMEDQLIAKRTDKAVAMTEAIERVQARMREERLKEKAGESRKAASIKAGQRVIAARTKENEKGAARIEKEKAKRADLKPEIKEFILLSVITFGCGALLLGATVAYDLPSGFYDVLRWLVSPAFVFFCASNYRANRRVLAAAIFIAAGIYNPITRVHFEKETWAIVNVAATIAFTILWGRKCLHMLFSRGQPRRLAWISLIPVILMAVCLFLWVQDAGGSPRASSFSRTRPQDRRMAPNPRRPPPLRKH